MIRLQTKEVAEMLGITTQALVKAMFDGRFPKPKNKVGRSFVWTPEEVEKASWVINKRSANIPPETITKADVKGLTIADVLQTVTDLPNEVVYEAYRKGLINA